MPAVRDSTWNYNTATTSTSIAAALPDYAQNDLLLAICSADTGTQTWSSSGYTLLFNITNTMNLAVLYKIAGAAETDPTFTYSVAETANVRLISIRDVNTTTPFNGTGGAGAGYRTLNNSAARVAVPVLTTTVANSLLLFINSESAAVVPGVLEGPCTFEQASDGTAHSDGFSWGFKSSIGASPSVFANKNGTAAGIVATIGISPPATGASVIPAYCGSDLSIYVDPIHGTTAYNGNTAFAATVTTDYGTTVNGRTLINGKHTSGADVGLNSFHSMGQLTGVTTANTIAGARLALATVNKPNASGKNVLCHVKPSTPKVYQNTDSISKNGTFPKGVYFGMASAASNFKLWHVHGSNTAWGSASHVPIVINNLNTTGVQQSTGTLNAASISSFGFGVSGFVVAPIMQFGSLWVLDTTTVVGGNATEPINIPSIYKICASGKERMSVLQQGSSQALVLQPIQIGDGGTNPTYLFLDSTAIEFPQHYNQDAKNVFYCSADNVAGLTYYAGPSDTIKHTNAVVSSQSKYHWRIHPSSSNSASWDFSGLSVIGAGDVQLKSGITFNSISFTNCPTITQNGGTIISSNLTSSKVISSSLANMSLISNSEFVSLGVGHAIEVSGTADAITFSGNKFTGYSSSNGSTGNEAIFVNIASGVVTINISGGGSTPSIRTAGATVNVISGATVTFTGLPIGVDIVILTAGTNSILAQVDTHPSSSYGYSYQGTPTIDVGFIKSGYIPYYIRGIALGSTDSSIPVSLTLDRNFI